MRRAVVLASLLAAFHANATPLAIRVEAGATSVVIAITNVSKRPVVFVSPDIDVLKGPAWVPFRLEVSCPCDSLCRSKIIELAVGATRTFTWDRLSTDCRPVSSSATLRAVVRGPSSEQLHHNVLLGISDAFH